MLNRIFARTLAIFHLDFEAFFLLLSFDFGVAVVIADKDSISGRQSPYSLQFSLFCWLVGCFC